MKPTFKDAMARLDEIEKYLSEETTENNGEITQKYEELLTKIEKINIAERERERERA